LQIPEGFGPKLDAGPFADANGPLFIRHADQALGFEVRREHCNPVNSCHDGWLSAFLDMQMPLIAIRDHAIRDRFLLTVSLSLDYLAPAPIGAWVEGSATVLRCTKSLVFIQGLVSSSQVLLMRGSGVYKIAARSSN
jgi:acyl-coenzyme A thioesterase PaaI-like protein